MVQTISGREKIDERWCAHQSPLHCYWQHFDCDFVYNSWWRQTNDGVGNERSISYTENNDTLHFNKISDEEKGCDVVGTAHAVFCTKTVEYGTVRNIWLVTKKEEIKFLRRIITIDETWVCNFKPKIEISENTLYKLLKVFNGHFVAVLSHCEWIKKKILTYFKKVIEKF